jgi:serine/threonine protein kinase
MSDLPLRLGNYELVRLLAQGGVADIYLARQRGLDRMVAVKVHRASDPDSLAMFRDEARLVGMLSHANLASVHEVAAERGVAYLAMEYVAGADLRELLAAAQKAGTAIPYEAAIAIVIGAAAGLDHAHRRCGPDGRPLHLVHRDVSLSNIMVGHDGTVKVIDFGIARSQVSSHHTRPGIVRGKASYMSPEQCGGDAVDLRTDVFALGVVLYELTTGRRCFAGASDFERMLAVVQGTWTLPSELVPSFPLALERVIRTALAPDPADRFASCAAMIEALERACELEGRKPGGVADLMATLFRAAVPVVPAEPTVRARRLARGTESDLWDDDAPTRGRRSMSRLWSPIAA